MGHAQLLAPSHGGLGGGRPTRQAGGGWALQARRRTCRPGPLPAPLPRCLGPLEALSSLSSPVAPLGVSPHSCPAGPPSLGKSEAGEALAVICVAEGDPRAKQLVQSVTVDTAEIRTPVCVRQSWRLTPEWECWMHACGRFRPPRASVSPRKLWDQ